MNLMCVQKNLPLQFVLTWSWTVVECCLWLPVAKQAFSAARSAWDCLTETLNIQQLFTHRYIINIQSVAYSCLWFKVNFLPARYLLIKNNCERCINYIGPSHNIGLENSDCDIIMAIDSIYLSRKWCFTLICVGLLIKWTSKRCFVILVIFGGITCGSSF